ncbi:M81 family metallopeptidase [Nitrospirillum sp. BR 11163]|uniref:M81 family metallopeptidase n=1 Tax=Nitrospirillum sp. BR 11163 TaxID=3104323 RepID=UPI002AFF55CA|nr:M81 family metallopeptidase [Nitrospirillum sp. BR 11163]MEA1672724.1 M81 family metallopeptidase [Nitrospirillum sp. BR 11163]
MRIFIAGLMTETNTFAPFPTGRRAFEEGGLYHENASSAAEGAPNLIARLFRDRATADGHEVVEGLSAFAQPGGRTVQSVYEAFREEILQALRAQGPFDVVLLALHGAMVATECDDCEGDLLRHVRGVVGDRTVIGVELDPHCHLTDAMVRLADAIVIMKEYPHVDYLARAAELYRLCVDAAAGAVRPVSAVFDCRMVGFYPTTTDCMAGVLRLMWAAEARPGVLSVSFAHGFPWADVADVGSKMLVVADGDRTLAETVAGELGREVVRLREALMPRFPTIDAALDLAVATPGRIVLADTADNAGGGAASDNSALLLALLEQRLRGVVLGAFWDPTLARVCAEAGEGASLPIRLGGKHGPASGQPVDLTVTVRAIREDFEQAGLGAGTRQPMGLTVWVEAEGIDLVINSVRTQVFSPDAFTGLGIDLDAKRFIIVKSSQHFQALFAPIADRVIQVATPGALGMDFAALPYTKRDPNYFPRVADPFA